LKNRIPPVALVLNSVRLNSRTGPNILPEKVVLANVLLTPGVVDSDQIVYMTASNELRINGTGLDGAKKLDIYFSPPLFKGIAYEMVSQFPLVGNQVVLRLRHGYSWREDGPGPLAVVGLDSGGGVIRTNGDDGVRVAEIQADLDLHGVTVMDTYSEQVIYHDAATVYIRGTGFNPLGTIFRFANGILGKGVNYTTTSLTETSATLRLVPGSHWRKNVENLPGFLTLLAANAGEGFVAVGATNAKKGRDIATVFERPVVYSGNTKLFRTHSHELHLFGEGFPKVLGKVRLEFDPPLTQDVDYTVSVIDRTEMIINLVDFKQWASEPSPLMITRINTRGDANGWVDLPGAGVHVAEIIEDVDSDTTGGVMLNPSSTKIYQSVLQDTLDIFGAGFQAKKISLVFEPQLKDGVDYDISVVSNTQLQLKLRRGKKWASTPGPLIVKSIIADFKTIPLANGDGIRVAVVYADPTVTTGKEAFHETQSKVIAVYGHGFTNVADVSVELIPTRSENFVVLSVSEDTIRLQLKEGYDWLPSNMNLDDSPEGTTVPLQLASINTGAGKISFAAAPVQIGNIVRDREGVICDDTCEFAFDGVCDDGSDMSYYYYGEANYYWTGSYAYMDDDLGGYYNDDVRSGDFYYYDNLVDDDYYMENEMYKVSACVEGTDCTDCGGVDAIVDWNKAVKESDSITVCSNTCIYARDGVCDDPRGYNYCKIGTDCQDCGPVGADNFTAAHDDGWWDDDDDYWINLGDDDFANQNNGPVANPGKIKAFRAPVESAGPAAVFLTVLEGLVYTIGSVFAAVGIYLFYRWYNGYSLPFMNAFSPENAGRGSLSEREFDMAPTKRMPITPDVIRT